VLGASTVLLGTPAAIAASIWALRSPHGRAWSIAAAVLSGLDALLIALAAAGSLG
jgi:hypothetical protein